MEQYEEFRIENPELAKYFDEDDDAINNLDVQDLPEGYPVYAHWEEAAKRII